jgi:hypothetical protein
MLLFVWQEGQCCLLCMLLFLPITSFKFGAKNVAVCDTFVHRQKTLGATAVQEQLPTGYHTFSDGRTRQDESVFVLFHKDGRTRQDENVFKFVLFHIAG